MKRATEISRIMYMRNSWQLPAHATAHATQLNIGHSGFHIACGSAVDNQYGSAIEIRFAMYLMYCRTSRAGKPFHGGGSHTVHTDAYMGKMNGALTILPQSPIWNTSLAHSVLSSDTELNLFVRRYSLDIQRSRRLPHDVPSLKT